YILVAAPLHLDRPSAQDTSPAPAVPSEGEASVLARTGAVPPFSRGPAASFLQQLAGPMQLRSQRLLARQGRAVQGCQDLVRQPLESILGHAGPVLGAEDQAHRGILVGVGPVLPGVGAVQVHLADVAGRELAKL